MSICDNCRLKSKCALSSEPEEVVQLVCAFRLYTRVLSAHYEPVRKTKKPPIVFVASYNEVIDLAFNPDTKDCEAAKAKDALNRAQKRGGDIKRFRFIIPFYPGKGKIRIALQSAF